MTPFSVVVGQVVGTTIASVTAAVLLIRMDANRPGLRVRDVLTLILCAAAGTALGATLGMLVIGLGHSLPAGGIPRIWRTWWLSDYAGALVVTPALLTWAGAGFRLARREALEAAALIALLIALTNLSSQRDVPYVLFPVLIWAALRFGPRGAAGPCWRPARSRSGTPRTGRGRSCAARSPTACSRRRCSSASPR